MSDFLALYLYFGVSIAALAVLSMMILLIGRELADCPAKGPALQIGALSTATGYAAIGLGALVLMAPAVDVFGDGLMGFFITLGVVLMALGLGFTNAMAILRGLARDMAAPPPDNRD